MEFITPTCGGYKLQINTFQTTPLFPRSAPTWRHPIASRPRMGARINERRERGGWDRFDRCSAASAGAVRHTYSLIRLVIRGWPPHPHRHGLPAQARSSKSVESVLEIRWQPSLNPCNSCRVLALARRSPDSPPLSPPLRHWSGRVISYLPSIIAALAIMEGPGEVSCPAARRSLDSPPLSPLLR